MPMKCNQGVWVGVASVCSVWFVCVCVCVSSLVLYAVGDKKVKERALAKTTFNGCLHLMKSATKFLRL